MADAPASNPTPPTPPEPPPITREVLALANAMATRIVNLAPDNTACVLRGGVDGIADDLMLRTVMHPDIVRPLIVRVLAGRALGYSPEGHVIFRGALDDIARQILHAIADPQAANPLTMQQAPPPPGAAAPTQGSPQAPPAGPAATTRPAPPPAPPEAKPDEA